MENSVNKPVYSDGTIEGRILSYLLQNNGQSSRIIQDIPEGAVFHNFTQARNNLLNWYPFTKQDTVLEIGAGMGALTPYLSSVCGRVVAVEPSADRADIIRVRCKGCNNVQVLTAELSSVANQEKFDYVLLIGVLEYAGIIYDNDPWLTMLREAKSFLKPNGKLLVAIENKYGLKYWCGAAEDHTGIPFDSINHYKKSAAKTSRYQQGSGVRTFDYEELKSLLGCVGLTKTNFYYPFPDYKFPMLILSDKSSDAAILTKSVKYNYPEESLLIADESTLFSDVIKNGTLHFFSNSFFVEAMENGTEPSDIVTVLAKRDYREEYRLTTIFEEGWIRKEAGSKKAEKHLRNLEKNTEYLQKRKIPCAEQKKNSTGGSVAPIIEGERADTVFEKALQEKDISRAVFMIEHLKKMLLQSSETYIEDQQIILKDGFTDLTFCNSFWKNDALLFFDQEWRIPDVPLKFILYRSIKYASNGVDTVFLRDFMLKYCEIAEKDQEIFEKMEKDFLYSLMDQTNLHWFDRTMYQPRLELETKVGTEIRNRDAHIEQLLQSERDLNNKVAELLSGRSEELDHLRGELLCKTGHIEQLLQSERDLQNEVSRLASEREEMKRSLSNREGHIELLLQTERDLRFRLDQLAEKHESVSEALRREKETLQHCLMEERELIRSQQQLIEEKTLRYQRLLEEKDAAYRQLAEEKDAAYEQLAEEKDAAYEQLAEEKDAAYEQLAEEKDAAYQKLAEEKDAAYQKLAEEKDAAYQKLAEENAISTRLSEEKAAAYQRMAEEKDAACQRIIQEKAAASEEFSRELAVLRQTVRNKEGHIELLLETDRELERIKASRSWRYMGYFWKLRDLLVPRGSKRRLLIKMMVKFVKHPIRFLSKCTPARIGKFFKTLKREGTEGVSRRLDDCLIGNEIQRMELKVESLPEPVQSAGQTAEAPSAKTVADYTPLHVPQWEEPTVSIVIPVYNQFDYTHLCVKSILEHSGDISYEILIADDCSTDLTTQIDDIIHGLNTIHNEQNLRFLRNCNNAAKQARGKYILFLNNDTQVQEDWLAPLVSLIERAPDIGMVGSKLVYPDGRLQEAGGILWKDGSAWNFGNRSDPDLPEFNYVKEADYISGAAIMIRKSLWEEIGGFDDRFAPAYCEDSDLAFEVRKHGYKVMYQPKSVVVHFEGVSNGTDTSSGQKAYQVINQQKFFEKWKDVLETEHNPNAENPFLARERGIGKKVLLMVDHYVPQFDKDAGSRTVYQYLQLFVDQGYHVKFIGDNFYPHQPYTDVLQQMGVEVLYGPYYAKHWKEWLKENGSSIQYAFLNRPHIAVNYIDEIRKYTPAKIVYYGHDLHFLREQREYELTGEESILRSSQEWQTKELALMRKADMAYYPSYVEEEEIHRIAPDVQVKAIPAYLFRNVEDARYKAENRQDLMFIGGFGHKPNVDAVKWLAEEVMPILEKRMPNVVINILGSNPPEEVKKLDGKHLKIRGFVTDEELEQYYRTCRMAIVPLRYGAGIKGKVVEAMRYGMPVVTTSVGAEGLAGVGKILAVSDSPEGFANKIASLYSDSKALRQHSRKSVQYIQENFSPDNAKTVIGPEFDME